MREQQLDALDELRVGRVNQRRHACAARLVDDVRRALEQQPQDGQASRVLGGEVQRHVAEHVSNVCFRTCRQEHFCDHKIVAHRRVMERGATVRRPPRTA